MLRANTENKSKTLKLDVLVVGILFLAIWIPRGLELDRFATPDEETWIARTIEFASALKHLDFESTYQSYHPGVTVMWTGIFSYLSHVPAYVRTQGWHLGSDGFYSFWSDLKLIDRLASARFIIVLMHTSTLLFAYFYLRRLIGLVPAFTALLLIAFNPFHIALSRVFHLDALLANLMLLSLLSFLTYLINKKYRGLVISGITFGLACLTKSPAFLFIPVAILLFGINSLQNFSIRYTWMIKSQMKQFVYPLFIWLLSGFLVFLALWPALWTNQLETLDSIFRGIVESASGHEDPLFFNGKIFPDGNIGISHFYFYPLTFLWRSSPVVLMGLVLILIGFINNWRPLHKKSVKLTLLGFCQFIVVFTVGITLIGKKFDRYLIPVYAPLDIFAALGWTSLVYWIQDRKLSRDLPNMVPLIILIAIGVQILLAAATAPYYFSYYNPLMGGSKKAPQVMMIGWGEGLDQAARYLNYKENTEQVNVISWYGGCPFACFFDGNSFDLGENLTDNLSANSEESTQFNNFDYAVLYVNLWQRLSDHRNLIYFDKLTPEHTIWLNGIEYARIYEIR